MPEEIQGLPLPMNFVAAAKIGIGKKDPKGPPTRLDHFEAFKPEPDDRGNYQPHNELNRWLNEWAKGQGLAKVTQVPINLFFNDVTSNWYATIANFRKSHTFCRNQGWERADAGTSLDTWRGVARRAVLDKDDRPIDYKLCTCEPGKCEYWGTGKDGKPLGCAPYGHLLFRIDQWQEGAPVYFSTRGWATIRAIQTGLAYAMREFAGRLADVELRLTLGTKAPYVSAVKHRQKIYVVSLEFGNVEEELARIEAKALRRTQALKALAASESAMAALTAGRYEELKALPSGDALVAELVQPAVTAAADAERELAAPDKHLGEFVAEGTYTDDTDEVPAAEATGENLAEIVTTGLPELPEEEAVIDGEIEEELELTAPAPSEDSLLELAARLYGVSDAMPALTHICGKQYENGWGKLEDDEKQMLWERLSKIGELYAAAKELYGPEWEAKLTGWASKKGAEMVCDVGIEAISDAIASITKQIEKKKGGSK